MKSIQTKYLGPTDRYGSRIVASAEGWGRAFVPFRHDARTERAHFEAVLALMAKVNKGRPEAEHVDPPTVYGGVKGGYVFCYPESRFTQTDGGQWVDRFGD